MLASSALLLTDPGPLCIGQTTTLTCNITGGISLEWNYLAERIGDGRIPTFQRDDANVQPPSGPVERGGVDFTVTLQMPTSPHLVSQISFTASAMMNGVRLLCNGEVGSVLEEQVITFQVVNGKHYSVQK